MRINVYEEELTPEVQVVETVAETDRTFYGVRIYLKSADSLHHSDSDTDRSALTIWLGTRHHAEEIETCLTRELGRWASNRDARIEVKRG